MKQLGEIKRNPIKVTAAFKRQSKRRSRRLHVTVDVSRASHWVGKSIVKSRESYGASACVALRGDCLSPKGYMTTLKRKYGDNRCANANAATPTAAVKKALAALSRKLK